MIDLVTLGETMALFRAVGTGSPTIESEFRLGIGGAESNVAIGVTRLGGSARWISRLGEDVFGARIARELRAEGVDVAARMVPAPTGLMVKTRRTVTSSQVLYYRAASAASEMGPEDIAEAWVPAKVLHITGITGRLSRTCAAAIAEAVQLARRDGALVSFDVNHRASLWGSREPSQEYRQLAAAADIVFAGPDEAAWIVPDASSPEEQAEAIAALGPTQVLIKLGPEGCIAYVDGALHRQPSIPVVAVDTVGAGDAFAAGYLAELTKEGTVAQRLQLAVSAGAFACLHPGDWEGYPTRSDLDLLASTEPVAR